jgi:multiple sugar transport system ATP-binding protein
MAGVSLADVTKVYAGGVKAVDRIAMEIRDREFVVLVGPSGCGKSTTLRMIAGLEEISSGTIMIGGRVVNDVPPKDRDIAMVFQNYALYPHMTVYKNMAFGLQLRRRALGLSRADIDRMVRETADLLGIRELLKRRPKALSGGQRQRVAVGRAIVRSPKVFLFDEPLSNLDAKLRLEMRSEIKRLQRRLATTTVYVTHDQEEAMTLGDRVVVMKDGVILQCSSPLNIYERPANRFVASFVGTPPMSFMDGRVVRRNGGLAFHGAGAESISLPAGLAARLSNHVDQDMVLGIRPDAFSTTPPATGSGTATNAGETVKLGVRIDLVEPLGDRKDVYMTVGSAVSMVGRLDARAQVREGEAMDIFVDLSRAHVFESGELGVNVTAMAEQAGASARAN